MSHSAVVESFLWQCPEEDGRDGDPSPCLIELLEKQFDEFVEHTKWIPGFCVDDALIRYNSNEGSPEEYMAHDFILTRNHHGAGFWDGDWAEPYATALTQIAHNFGEVDGYVGDDGLVYLHF